MKQFMPALMDRPVLLVISDGTGEYARLLRIASELAPVIDGFILREKHWTARQMWEWGEELLRSGFPRHKLIINDRLDVSLALAAGGVQITSHSVPLAALKPHLSQEMAAGVSVHSLSEGLEAATSGAQWVLFGHIFQTPSKPGLPGHGTAVLKNMVDQLPVPVIAVGGITPDNAAQVLATGCAGIAVISAVMSASKPLQEAMALKEQIARFADKPAHNDDS